MQDAEKKKPELEQKNFKINSHGWRQIIVQGNFYLVNPEGDVWEFAAGKFRGEQLFTWDAAMREAKKAGKQVPTDEEFSSILKIGADMPNLVHAGSRDPSGAFSYRGLLAYFWSSSQYREHSAWAQCLGLETSSKVKHRYYNFGKANALSVRCLKNK